MKCPFVKGTYMYSCAASNEVYVPSAFEFEEYCRSTRYKICPLYCKALGNGNPTCYPAAALRTRAAV